MIKQTKKSEKLIAGVPETVFKGPGLKMWLTSPRKAARIKRRMQAALGLLGMWADKDTSFFDKR